ncbi:CU044_5270 family protein [Actinoallomurus soli]|uniref:CU044_5270 family protein n=1 Tax=Actinoallomurus soli TaxID=2952535 RepID=UPI0020935763|nr:CU044_5270 family protein [Actinoallomurus soli]MCO5971520.1 CU044_5270 family protein [Actinoallomurus soli]
MDEELTMLATALAAPEPSEEAADRSRHRLQNTMRGGPVRRRRTGRLAGGLGLTAATAATAILVSTTGTTHTAHPNSPPSTAERSLSARQILLAAATTAEKAPATSGAYWYVKQEERDGANAEPTVAERWTRHDGEIWRRDLKTEGEIFHEGVLPGRPKARPFDLGTDFVSFQQIQRLPTDPDRLKAWLADSAAHSDMRTSAGRLTAEEQRLEAFESLVMLLSTLPAPPKVRAAAFRALASYPNVKVAGRANGGQVVRFTLPKVTEPARPAPSTAAQREKAARWAKDRAARAKAQAARGETHDDPPTMVVDPATAQVRETNFLALGGGEEWFPDGGGVRITTAWTDALPK